MISVSREKHMLKILLRLVLALSIVILSFGMTFGVYKYQMEGSIGMLVLSGIGIILWIPTIYLVVKYLNEEEEE